MATALTDIRHLLIDLDGVVVRGRRPLPGAAEFFELARSADLRFAVLTNNSTRTAADYAAFFAEIGVPVGADEIFTSSRATLAYLQSLEPAATVYAIGEAGLLTYLREGGYTLTEESPRYVVVGLDRRFSYDKLRLAQRAVFDGARLIATNPDTTFPGEHGIVPGCGSLVAAVEAASGVRATVIGKPFPAMFESAMAHMGATPATTAIVGDRLDTDIDGGARAGLATVLVLTGVTDEPMLRASSVRPDFVYPTLLDFGRALAAARA